jgi:purine-binding chemotaxis protein CheW
MRDAFDRTFALPPRDVATATVDLLAVRIGGRPYALRMADLAGLHPALTLTPVPTTTFALRGLAQIGPRIVPAYDLRLLLGHQADESPGCFVMTAQGEVAMGIDAFERHVRVTPDRIVGRDIAKEGDPSVTAMVVEADDIPRPLLSLRAVLDSIRARLSAEGTKDKV